MMQKLFAPLRRLPRMPTLIAGVAGVGTLLTLWWLLPPLPRAELPPLGSSHRVGVAPDGTSVLTYPVLDLDRVSQSQFGTLRSLGRNQRAFVTSSAPEGARLWDGH